MADFVAFAGLGFFDDGGGISSYDRFGIAIQRDRIKYLKAYPAVLAEAAANGHMGKEWFDALYTDPERSIKAFSEYERARKRQES